MSLKLPSTPHRRFVDAISSNNINALNDLIASKVDVNCRSNIGISPLISAAIHNNTLALKILLSAGVLHNPQEEI